MTVVNDGQWDKIKAQAFKPDVVILNSPICIWKCSVGIRCVVASSSSISGKAAWLEAAAWLAAMWLPPCLGEVHSRSWCNTMASPFWEIKNTGKHPSNLSSILVNLHIHGVKVCKSGGYSCMWIKNTIHTLPTPLLACSDNVLKYQLCQLSSSKSHVHSHPTSQEKSTIKIGTRISMTQVPTGHSWKQDPSMLYHFNSIHLSMFIFPPRLTCWLMECISWDISSHENSCDTSGPMEVSKTEISGHGPDPASRLLSAVAGKTMSPSPGIIQESTE